jgi:hypothetical protein
MTTHRDFDRITRAWLDLMPDEAPDRAIATVLQAIETTPQVRRRFGLAVRRSFLMNRVSYAALAAVLVVAVASGAVLLGQAVIFGPGTSVATPRGALPSPSSAGAPVSAELQGRWLGGHRDIVQAGAGTTILLNADRYQVTQSNSTDNPAMFGGASSVGAGRIRLESNSTTGGCEVGAVGLYAWSISASGRVLTITPVEDDCAARAATVPGTWWRNDCRYADAFCLGELDPGTYKSQYVTPLVRPTEAWEPTFGGLTYTVPAGWANNADFPSTFGLSQALAFVETSAAQPEPFAEIFVITNVVAAAQFEKACSATPEPAVDETAQAIADWVTGIPHLIELSEITPISIGGLAGVYVDLMVPELAGEGSPCGERLVEYLVSAEHGYAIANEERQRLILLDTPRGGVLAIRIEADEMRVQFDPFASEAMPIIESFKFE